MAHIVSRICACLCKLRLRTRVSVKRVGSVKGVMHSCCSTLLGRINSRQQLAPHEWQEALTGAMSCHPLLPSETPVMLTVTPPPPGGVGSTGRGFGQYSQKTPHHNSHRTHCQQQRHACACTAKTAACQGLCTPPHLARGEPNNHSTRSAAHEAQTAACCFPARLTSWHNSVHTSVKLTQGTLSCQTRTHGTCFFCS